MCEFVTLTDYENTARQRIRPDVWDFLVGGAGEETTLHANEVAFKQVRLRPRVLTDVGHIDTTVRILGRTWAAPLGIAPTALHKLCHPAAEIATARAAAAAGLPITVSTFASLPIEDIAAAVPDATIWQQLYIFKDRGVTASMVERAEPCVQALVVTVDSPWLGRRHRNLRNRFRMPPDIQAANLAVSLQARPDISDPAQHSQSTMDPSLTWWDLEWLITITDLPVIVKGILTAEDAERAINAGAQAIIVSNHGARQLDRAPATLEALPEVAEAARSVDVPVLLDGGVRSGEDVLVALALGANAVLIGRPALYGLAVAGQQGVHNVLTLLIEQLTNAMGLSGRPTVDQVGPDLLRLAGLFHRENPLPGTSPTAVHPHLLRTPLRTVPRSAKHARLQGPDRTSLGAHLKQRYEEGASIRQLAATFGRSYGFTRALLAEAGTAFRRPGIPKGNPTGEPDAKELLESA